MKQTVTVAEMADPNLPPEERIFTIPDLDRPWSEHLQVKVEVEDGERLGDLLRRAGKQLDGLGPYGSRPEPWAPTYLAMDVQGERPKLWNELPLVDSEGRIRWNWRWQDEPYIELLRATEAGAVPGNPRRLYFIRAGGMGDGIVSAFPEFIELMQIQWELIRAFLDVVGLAQAMAWLIGLEESAGRGERANEVTQERANDWRTNGGLPHKIKEIVRRDHGWKPQDLGRLLKVTEPDAQALLTAFGCKEGADGVWRPGQDEVSKLMAGNADLALASANIDRDAFRAEAKKRLDAFVETGKAPEPDYEALQHLPLDPHWSANQFQADNEPVPFESLSRRRRMRRWFRKHGWG